MRQHAVLWFATRSSFTIISKRHDCFSSTQGQIAGYLATSVSQRKWTIHSVPLWDAVAEPLPERTAWISFWDKAARETWGRVKSKAKTWHLLKCHTVDSICMWKASETATPADSIFLRAGWAWWWAKNAELKKTASWMRRLNVNIIIYSRELNLDFWGVSLKRVFYSFCLFSEGLWKTLSVLLLQCWVSFLYYIIIY